MSVDRKILQWLENEIFEGRIALGDNLPNDRKLADAIKSSHNSTREALKRLETMGILNLYEGKRKAIIPQLLREPSGAVAPALRLHMASARYPARDLVQTRIALESWAVERAVPGHPAMAEIEELLQQMQVNGIMPTDFHHYEVQFHLALVKLADNHLMIGLMTALRDSLNEFLLSLMGKVPLWSATATRLRAEYQAIFDALQAGENALAAQLVVSNIEGQYREAGIDLDEETGVANDLPGSVASMEPIEVDTDDLIPDEWEEAVSPDVIAALESFGSLGDASGPERLSSSERNPKNLPTSEKTAETHRESRSEHALETADYIETKTQKETPETTSTADSNILRAPASSPRRRRGTVSTPVHATVIAPLNRSALPEKSGVISGQVPSRSERPLDTPKTDDAQNQHEPSWAEQVAQGLIKAKPRLKKVEESSVEPETQQIETETEQPRISRPNRLSKWLGFNRSAEHEETEEVSAEKSSTSEDTESWSARDIESEELARKQRLAALIENMNQSLENNSEAEQVPVQAEDVLPDGYELASETIRSPEIVDDSAPAYKPQKKQRATDGAETKEQDSESTTFSDEPVEQKVHSINKNVKKKKKKRR